VADVTAAAVTPATIDPEFDDETLGGYIKYATILAPVGHLTEQLKGLIIRDPQNPLVPASSTKAGGAQGGD